MEPQPNITESKTHSANLYLDCISLPAEEQSCLLENYLQGDV